MVHGLVTICSVGLYRQTAKWVDLRHAAPTSVFAAEFSSAENSPIPWVREKYEIYSAEILASWFQSESLTKKNLLLLNE